MKKRIINFRKKTPNSEPWYRQKKKTQPRRRTTESWYKKRKPQPKKKVSWFAKKKPDTKQVEYNTKYNIYSYDHNGRARKVRTSKDKKEAESWVSNKKAMSPNSVYKIIPDIKKKGW